MTSRHDDTEVARGEIIKYVTPRKIQCNGQLVISGHGASSLTLSEDIVVARTRNNTLGAFSFFSLPFSLLLSLYFFLFLSFHDILTNQFHGGMKFLRDLSRNKLLVRGRGPRVYRPPRSRTKTSFSVIALSLTLAR